MQAALIFSVRSSMDKVFSAVLGAATVMDVPSLETNPAELVKMLELVCAETESAAEHMITTTSTDVFRPSNNRGKIELFQAGVIINGRFTVISGMRFFNINWNFIKGFLGTCDYAIELTRRWHRL